MLKNPWLLLFLAPSLACTSLNVAASARTLSSGQVQMNAGVSGFRVENFQDTANNVLPVLEAGARVGVNDWNELGLRVVPIGIGILSRHALVRGDDPARGLNISLEPELAAFPPVALAGGPSRIVILAPQLKLYGGWRFNHHELMLVPRFLDFMHVGRDGSLRHVPYVGLTAAAIFQVTDRARLGPQISFLKDLGAYRGVQEGQMLHAGLLIDWTL